MANDEAADHLSQLLPEQIEELLSNYPPLPSDSYARFLDYCAANDHRPVPENLHAVKRRWASSYPDTAQTLSTYFQEEDCDIGVLVRWNGPIGNWYNQYLGQTFRAFSYGRKHDEYTVIVKYTDTDGNVSYETKPIPASMVEIVTK